MHLKSFLARLVRLSKPDKRIYSDMGDDQRKLGIMLVGAGAAGGLLQSSVAGWMLSIFGGMIWSLGMYFCLKAKSIARKTEDDQK